MSSNLQCWAIACALLLLKPGTCYHAGLLSPWSHWLKGQIYLAASFPNFLNWPVCPDMVEKGPRGHNSFLLHKSWG